MHSLDKVDKLILERLLDDGRASFSQLARETKLTDVAIKKRVERLQKKGILKSISAQLDYASLGYQKPVFLHLRVDPSMNADVKKKLQSMDHVMELYDTMGEYNLLVKLVSPSMELVHRFLQDLGRLGGVRELKSHVVLNEAKRSASLPTSSLQKRL